MPVEHQWSHCPLCGIKYPCQHVSAKDFALKTVKRWESYPANLLEPQRCVEFDSSGFCTSFHMRGYCHFQHDKEEKINSLEIPWGRCKVCTLLNKKRCFVHDPPLGSKLSKADKSLVVDGSDVEERFAVGEIVGVASASAGGYVYSVVVQAASKVRMYTVATYLLEEGRFSKNTGHKSLGKLHGAQFRGWEWCPCVMELRGTTTASLKAAEVAKSKPVEDAWTFNFKEVALQQDDGGNDGDSDDELF